MQFARELRNGIASATFNLEIGDGKKISSEILDIPLTAVPLVRLLAIGKSSRASDRVSPKGHRGPSILFRRDASSFPDTRGTILLTLLLYSAHLFLFPSPRNPPLCSLLCRVLQISGLPCTGHRALFLSRVKHVLDDPRSSPRISESYVLRGSGSSRRSVLTLRHSARHFARRQE